MALNLSLNLLVTQENLVLEIDLRIHFFELAQLLNYIHSHQLSETDVPVALQVVKLPMSFSNFAISEHLEEWFELEACL